MSPCFVHEFIQAQGPHGECRQSERYLHVPVSWQGAAYESSLTGGQEAADFY